MAITKFLDITGLTEFKNLLMTDLLNVVSAEDAKAIKAVSQSSDGYTLYFYKKTNPVSSTEAAFSITLPSPVDITGKMDKVASAVAGHIAVFRADGSVADSGSAPDAFATAAQGKKADTAVQSIQKSETKGSINVDGKDIPVNGLTATAFAPLDSFETAGAAQAVKTELTASLESAKTDISALETRADQAQASLASITDSKTGILANAKKYTDDNIQALHIENYTTKTYVDSALSTKAESSSVYAKSEIDTKVSSLQGSINNVKAYVGEIPEDDPAKDVISYLKDLIRIAENEASYDDTAVKASIQKNTAAIGVLNGTGDGSVSKAVADGIARIVADAPESLDTLKEISDWILQHEPDAAAMNTKIIASQKDISDLSALVGKLPEGAASATLVGYIAEYVGTALDNSDLSQYAKAADLDSAVDRIAAGERSVAALQASLAEGGATANAITAAKKAGTDAQASVNALSDKMGAVPEGSATLKDYIDKQDNALRSSVSSLSNDADKLRDDVSALTGRVDESAASITGNTSDIAKLKTDVQKAQTDTDQLTSYVGAFRTDDQTIKTVVQYIDKKSADAVASSKYDDTSVKADIKKNQDDIASINDPGSGILATALTQTAAQVSGALKDSKTYTDALRDGDVAANSAAIGRNAGEIDALKTKVGDGFTSITLSEIQALFDDSEG